MLRFLTSKYRSLMVQKGRNISDKDFMENYVEPYVVYENNYPYVWIWRTL